MDIYKFKKIEYKKNRIDFIGRILNDNYEVSAKVNVQGKIHETIGKDKIEAYMKMKKSIDTIMGERRNEILQRSIKEKN
jgi:hypothetical protein